MNRLNARAVATLGAGKYNDGAGLLLHKRKDGGAHERERAPHRARGHYSQVML